VDTSVGKTPAISAHLLRKPKIKRITVSGQELRVGVWPGERTNTPLLIFNGIGSRLELLQPFIQSLDPEREVIVFDVPGTGESPAPRLPYRLWMLALLTSRLLDVLDRERVHVMGVSWGGAIAQQFAFQKRTRCEKLILAATTPGVLMIPGKFRVLSKMASPRRFADRNHTSDHFGTLYGGEARTSPDLLAQFASLMGPPSRRGYLFQQLALVGWSSLPLLPFLRQPTLILAGDDDPLVPLANAKIMSSLIPRCRMHVFKDGHLFLMSKSIESAAAVDGFLKADSVLPGPY
jgi:poly(3-hydroxyalkanoate) depolymerase